MPLFVGVEGVNLRQSVAVLADETGKVLGAVRSLGKSLSYHTVGKVQFRSRLVDLLQRLSNSIGLTIDDLRDATVCIGLTGVNSTYELAFEIPAEIESADLRFARLICTGDAEIVLASHAHSLVGSVILSHIGSVVLVKTGTTFARLGGWGPTFADEGSGYWIGRRALQAVGVEAENATPSSHLWNCINEWLIESGNSERVPDWRAASYLWRDLRTSYNRRGIDQRLALLSLARNLSLHKDWQWRLIASSLVIPVMRAWAGGDEIAKQIVKSAASDLVRMYKKACQKVGAEPGQLPLVLYGGVLNHNPTFRQLVVDQVAEQQLQPSHIITNTSREALRPACGALLYALGDSSQNSLRLPPNQIVQTIAATQNHQHINGELSND
jgi:N-acetylglucosamine kinase-like BadF-type ATPase